MNALLHAAKWLAALGLLLAALHGLDAWSGGRLANAAAALLAKRGEAPPPRIAAAELLRSETLAFLVLNRHATQVVVELQEASPLLGRREGFLYARARLYHGVDLKALAPDRVRDEGGRLVVLLPAPSVLDFAVDLKSVRFRSSRSGLAVVADFLAERDMRKELEGALEGAARRFFEEEGLLLSGEEAAGRLNRWAETFAPMLDKPVVFVAEPETPLAAANPATSCEY